MSYRYDQRRKRIKAGCWFFKDTPQGKAITTGAIESAPEKRPNWWVAALIAITIFTIIYLNR
jgi:hypothetical protein